jgi:hypothetical protein
MLVQNLLNLIHLFSFFVDGGNFQDRQLWWVFLLLPPVPRTNALRNHDILGIPTTRVWSGAEQSRAEQSRAEQSRAEQSRAEQQEQQHQHQQEQTMFG